MRFTHTLYVGGLTVAAMTGPLLAQVPPKPGPPPTGSALVSYIIMALLVGVVCMGALKSSKRSHQD